MKLRDYLHPELEALVTGYTKTLRASDFDPFQKWMRDTFLTHKRVLMGAFMGSGKTATALHAARLLIDAGMIKRVLVVAPIHVAKDTWPDELMVWDFARKFEFAVILGDPKQREKARLRDVELHITNRENFRWLCNQWGKAAWPYDLMIYDEASRMKGGRVFTKPPKRPDGSRPKGKRSEFGFLKLFAPKTKWIWELTGTPSSNGLIDLWGPISVLDDGARLGRSLYDYKQRWFREHPYTRELTPFDHSEAEITRRCADIFYCLDEKEYMKDLPPVVLRDRWVHLEPSVLAAYRKFERSMFLEEHDIEAITNGVLANKLLQFANGSVYDEHGEGKYVHSRKLDELESVVAEAGGRPMMIAYSYKFDLTAITKRFPKFRIYGEGANDRRDWNLGRIPGLLIHPASAGHGLNFQEGGNIAVWFGLNWSLELYQQFNKRLPRRGQKESRVYLYRILAHHTNDLRVADGLEIKGATQDRITAALRVHWEDIWRLYG